MASCFASSVFPTPVGPVKRNEPIVLSWFLRPVLDNLIADDRAWTALSWPKIKVFKSLSKLFNLILSSDLMVFSGILAIFEIVSWISETLTFFIFFLKLILTEAALSSIISIALSGNFELSKYFFDKLTASEKQSSSNSTEWNFS